jgi:hypothetical protein
VIYDRGGRYPEFVEHFHKLLARSQNALRGRWENFWASEQVCVVRLVDHDAVMDKLVYTATNPVQDHLVDRVHHWPGVNGLAALLAGRSLQARRPRHFFRPDGPMPEEVELRLTIPAELGPEAEVLAELRDRVLAVEAEREAERQRTGRRVLGRRAVLQQSWRAYPSSVEPRRNLRPQVAPQQVVPDRGAAAQPRVHRGLHTRAGRVARGQRGRISAGHILAPTVRQRERGSDVT